MSTYTDLRNRVKENIVVDYNNRITPQHVRFLNEQNEYWGTLKGNVSAEGINIVGGTLSGITLTDTILKGSVALPDGIDLHKVLQQIKQISVDLIQTNENLDEEIDNRQAAVEAEKDMREADIASEAAARYLTDRGLSTSVDQTNKDMKRELSTLNIVLTHQDQDISSYLNNKIDNETALRIADVQLLKANDNYLSDAIINSKADFGREVFDRKIADEKLELNIAAVSQRSQVRDNELSAELSAHIEENRRQFDDLNLSILNRIEHDRHYEIYKGQSTYKTTDCWPYDCKDFAVNIYNPTLNDGAVYYNDNAGKRYEIGALYKNTLESLYPFNFKTLKGIQHDGVASALVDNWSYGFDVDKKSQRTLMNGYTITFNDEKSTHQLSDYTFTVAPTLPQFHKLTYHNHMVGKITQTLPEDYTEDIISGLLWFDCTDTELQTFNKFRKVAFNTTDLSVCNKQTERVTYLGNNKFKFEKNIDRAQFIGLYDKLDSRHTQFGRIYSTYDNISGIISDDAGIYEVNVRLSDPYNKIVSLKNENGYINILEENVKQGDLYYNVILSANIHEQEFVGNFDMVKVSELYKYEFNGIDKEGHRFVGGYIVPKKYNKTILQSLDFDEVDANISNVMWIDAFKKTYTLTKTSLERIWTCEDRDNDGNVLNVMFNGQTLFIKVTSGNSGEIVRTEHDVNTEYPIIFNADTCYKHIYETEYLDLSKYSEKHESPEATFEMIANSDVTSETFPRYELGIDVDFTGVMKIKMPERTSLDISREFMVVINPDYEVDRLVQLMFVDKDGKEVKLVNNRHNKILLPTNKWTTLQIKEIDNNMFFVKDLDDNEDMHDIEFLSNAISVETQNRIANDSYLSAQIDLSVDSLQQQIISNDVQIADIYEKIKGGINYKGVIYGELSDSSGNIIKIPTISNLFVWNKHHYSINNYTEDTILSNGFMYNMKQFGNSSTLKFNIEGIDIEVRDSLIINCRTTDPTCNGKAIKDITSADVDVIDAEDHDVIHRPELTEISTFLSNEIKANDNDIHYLSNEISNIEWIQLSGFYFLSSNVDYVSSEVSSNNNDIAYLSDNVKFLLSVDKETMNYKGTLPYLPNLSDDGGHDLGHNYLSTFILQSKGIFAPGRAKLGDFFKLSAVQSCLWDANKTECWFGEKDSFVINKDKMISDIVIADLDIFRNAESEVSWLSAHLCAEIDNLSTSLSTTTKLSAEELQRQIISNDNDIKFLSDEVDSLSTRLSNDIDALSTSLSDTTRLSVEELQRQVISNDNDIIYLSDQVDFLLSVGHDSMEYKGTIPHYEPVAPLTADYNLSAFLKPMVADPVGFIKKGFMYRLSAMQNTLSDETGYTTYLGEKDFFVINKDCMLSNVKFSDLDIFRNAESEVSWLSAHLCAEIDNLSTSLSTTTRLSVEELQRQIISNDIDLSNLSDDLSIKYAACAKLSIANEFVAENTFKTNVNINKLSAFEETADNLVVDMLSVKNKLSVATEVDFLSSSFTVKEDLVRTVSKVEIANDLNVSNNISIEKDLFVNENATINKNLSVVNCLTAIENEHTVEIENAKITDVLTADFSRIIDNADSRYLSSYYLYLTDENKVLEIAALINDIIDTAGLAGIENIDITTHSVRDIKDRTEKICERARIKARTDTLHDICTSLNETLNIFKVKGTSLEIRLATMKHAIDTNERYMLNVEKYLSADVDFLSDDLHNLEHNHYNKTLSNDILLQHTYEDEEHHKQYITTTVDQLVMVDEVTFDRYRLTIRNGSLNINKIDSLIPTV